MPIQSPTQVDSIKCQRIIFILLLESYHELLDECSSLTSLKDWRDHVGDPSVYQFSAFARRHDAYISVRPCTPGEPVCVDDRSSGGVPFFFFYQTVFNT